MAKIKIFRTNVIEILKQHPEWTGSSDINYNNKFIVNEIKNLLDEDKEYSGEQVYRIIRDFAKEGKPDGVYCHKLSIDYWIHMGWSLAQAKEKAIEFNKGEILFFNKKELKRYVIKENPYNMNIDNKEYVDEYIDYISSIDNFSIAMTLNSLYQNTKVYLNKLYKKYKPEYDNKKSRCTMLSVEFYYARGFSKEYADKMILKEQRERSSRCQEHYIKKGYSEKEAKEMVSDIQKKYTKSSPSHIDFWLNSELDEEEAKRKHLEWTQKRTVWGMKYWLERGYSEEDARIEILKRNSFSPTCMCYQGDYRKYRDAINKIMENRSLNKKKQMTNPDNKYMIKEMSEHRISKSQIKCFDMVKEADNNTHTEPYIVQFPETFISSVGNVYYYACDGYIECEYGVIIVEYDSKYYHNQEEDELRDQDIFYLDDNVIGILRITENFLKTSYEGIRQQRIDVIKYAIELLKQCVIDRIILNEFSTKENILENNDGF